MKAMVDEFARYARMPQPRPTAVDLRRLVDETVHLYRDIKPGLEVSASVESDGDAIHHRAIGRLFSGEMEALEVLKWKDIIDEAEGAIDQLEDVSNMLETIALKHG